MFVDKDHATNNIRNAVKPNYVGKCFIPLTQWHTKAKKTSAENSIYLCCLVMHKEKTANSRGRTRQKFFCYLQQPKLQA